MSQFFSERSKWNRAVFMLNINYIFYISIIIGLFINSLAGYFDGKAFAKASLIWQSGFSLHHFVVTVFFFLLGVFIFIGGLKFFQLAGITNPLITTITWFVVTVFVTVFESGGLGTLNQGQRLTIVLLVVGISYLFYSLSESAFS